MAMAKLEFRNIAIIAHVDHGKTTLVDKMLRQAGAFRENQVVMERVMDSNPLERERGITILAKNTSIRWHGTKINIIDTPGHSDFGGEVERIASHGERRAARRRRVRRADAADALRAAQGAGARPHADRRDQQDRPARRGSDARARRGARPLHRARGRRSAARRAGRVCVGARRRRDDGHGCQTPVDLSPLFQAIVDHVPPPPTDAAGPFQMLISTIDYSPYLGRLGIGRIERGQRARRRSRLRCCRSIARMKVEQARVTKLFGYEGLERIELEEASGRRDRRAGGTRDSRDRTDRHGRRESRAARRNLGRGADDLSRLPRQQLAVRRQGREVRHVAAAPGAAVQGARAKRRAQGGGH